MTDRTADPEGPSGGQPPEEAGGAGGPARADDAAAEAAAEARSRGYHLLARLLAHGPTSALRAAAETVPALAAALPPAVDPDAVSADHHALFGFDVLPYEGVFRDADALLGGPVTAAVAGAYAAAGWAPPDDGESPDHAAVELAFLAWLAAREADALRARDGAERARVVAARDRFAAEHVLHWLPALAAAVEASGPHDAAPFHAAVLGLAIDLAADHVGCGTADGAAPGGCAGARAAAECLLGEPRTGLRDIAAFLTRPARSGAYLGRGAVGRAARRAGVLHGFGDRTAMLADALASAAHLERVDGLAGALGGEIAAQEQAMARRRAAAAEAGWDVLERALAPWAERAAASRWLLERLGDVAWPLGAAEP